MKKILIFSLQYYPLVGGAEVAIKEITDRIPPSDIEFHMVTLRFKSESPKFEKLGNVFVHRIGFGSAYLSKILFVPLATLAAWRLDRTHHFDAAWAMMSYMVLPIVLGWRKPYALTLQDGDPFERVFERWYIQPFLPMLRSGFRHATQVSVLSNYLATWVKKMGYAGDIEIIPNGADIERFANATPVQFEKDRDDIWLVTSSRLVYKNAVDDVIRALAPLPTKIKFLVLGIGPEEEKLKELTASLSLTDRVRFLGYVSHAELPGYLHACDIFIRPSRTEGFGASFPEAFAAGIPVIATQEGGIADFLFDEKRNPDKEPTGWAVDKDSPERIAEAVNDIIANPEKVKRVIANAAKLVREKYDWNLIAKQSQAFFERTAESNAKTRITIATPLYPPDVGGPAQYARGIEDELVRRGYDVLVVVYSNVERSLPVGIRHLWYFFRLLPHARRARAILALDTWSVGIPALLAARLTGARLLVRIGGDFLWETYIARRHEPIKLSEFYEKHQDLSLKERIIEAGTYYLLQHADVLLFNSNWQRDIWRKAYDINPNKAFTFENYFPKERSFTETDSNVFVFAGRAHILKNEGRVKQAFHEAQKKFPNITLDTRSLSPDEHKKRVAESRAVIIASLSDVNPNNAVDAITYGKPFIITSDTGARVKDLGISVDPTDVKALQAAIETLVDPKQYQAYAQKIRAFTYARSWTELVDELLRYVETASN